MGKEISNESMSVKNDELHENLDANELTKALVSIANEVQRYHSGDRSKEDLTDDINVYKLKLKAKRKQFKALNNNLKTACLIAKTVMSAKKKKVLALTNNPSYANNSINLRNNDTELAECIHKLSIENHNMKEKMQDFVSFIQLGYQELQNMRDTKVEELPVIMQLKELMIGCGQYYADYCNEHEKCVQLEQKNRFLSNKINILECSLQNVTAELKKLQNKERTNELQGKKIKDKSQKVGHSFSENHFGKKVSVSRFSSQKYVGDGEQTAVSNKSSSEKYLDLSSHLSLVKNLLNDQDNMLQELKKLSDELSITPGDSVPIKENKEI